MNALPALQQVMLDGWVLRFGGGFTGRANSIYPLYSGTRDAGDKIATCERLYDEKKIPPLFKMTAAVEPEALDQLLESRGYTAFNHTSVQIRELTTATPPTTAADDDDDDDESDIE